MEVNRQLHFLAALQPQKKLLTPTEQESVDPRTSPDISWRREKSLAPTQHQKTDNPSHCINWPTLCLYKGSV